MQPPIDGSTRKTYAVSFFFLILFALGSLVLNQSRHAWMGTAMPGEPGPFFLSQLCLWAIGIAGAILLAIALLARGQEREGKLPTGAVIAGARAWLLAILLVASLLAMPTLMDVAGTAIAVAIFAVIWIGLLFWLRDGASWRTAAMALGFGIAAAIFVNLIFVRLLTLPLP